MRSTGDLPTVIITIVIVFCILFVGTIVANQAAPENPDGETISTTADLDGTTWSSVTDTHQIGTNEVVHNSLGNGLQLDSGEFQSDSDVDALKSEHWGVSVWASVNSSHLNDKQALLQIDDSLVLYYNGSAPTPTWTAWYYDYTDPQTVSVSVDATEQESLTNIQVIRDGSTLEIHRNATDSQTASLTGDSTAAKPDNLSNWNGAMEELRVFRETPSASQHDKLYSEPVEPLPGIDTALRIYFDTQDGNEVPMYFTDGEVTTTNASLTTGFAGDVMEGASIWKDVTGQTDYRWDRNGPRIKAADGGRLDGAPVAFVAFETNPGMNGLVSDWNQAMSLAGLLFVILPLGVAVVYLRSSRGGR